MHKQTKATNIPDMVKGIVWKRDNHCCVLCGSHMAAPNAHYIARSHGGLGIEQNIVTLCLSCHDRYDNSADRMHIRTELQTYLKSKYPNWDETKLTYRKWDK